MKKSLVLLLTFAFMLSFNSCKKGKMSSNAKYIPEGTNVIAEINYNDLMKIKKFKKEADFYSKPFSHMTGIKTENIKVLTLFSTIKTIQDADNPKFGVLLSGKGFNKDFVKKSKKKNYRKLEYNGNTIFMAEDKMGFAFLDKAFVFGNTPVLKKVIDLSKGKVKKADMSEFKKLFSKLNARSVRLAVLIPKESKTLLSLLESPIPVDGFKETVNSVKSMAFGANVSSSEVEIKIVLKGDSKSIKKLV